MPHIYTHLLHTAPPPPPTHHVFLLFDCYIPLFGPLSFTNGAFDSIPNVVWAHKMVVVEEAPLVFFPGLTFGTPKKGSGYAAIPPSFGPPRREG